MTPDEARRRAAEKSLDADRCALEEGVVAVGGLGLAQAAESLNRLSPRADEKTGIDIVYRAWNEPSRQLRANGNQETTEQLTGSGVTDATTMVRVALQSAADMSMMMMLRTGSGTTGI